MILEIKGRVLSIIYQYNKLSLKAGGKCLIGFPLRMTMLKKVLLYNLSLKGLHVQSIEDIVRYVSNSVKEYKFKILLGE